MSNDEYIIAYGWGIKENTPYSTYVLIASVSKKGSITFSTINSSDGGVRRHYVRFLSEQEAQKFIDKKLDKDKYIPYRAKSDRVLKLVDSKYNLYIGGVKAPVGVIPAIYNKNGELEKSAFPLDDFTPEYFVKFAKENVEGRPGWDPHEEGTKPLEDALIKSGELIRSKLGVTTRLDFWTVSPVIKDVKNEGNNIKYLLDIKCHTRTDYAELNGGSFNSVDFDDDKDLYDKLRWFNFQIKIRAVVPLDKIISKSKSLWDDGQYISNFGYYIIKALIYFGLENVSTNSPEVVKVMKKYEEHLKEIIKSVDTEDFLESLNKKDVKNILYDLYDDKIKY